MPELCIFWAISSKSCAPKNPPSNNKVQLTKSVFQLRHTIVVIQTNKKIRDESRSRLVFGSCASLCRNDLLFYKKNGQDNLIFCFISTGIERCHSRNYLLLWVYWLVFNYRPNAQHQNYCTVHIYLKKKSKQNTFSEEKWWVAKK